MYVMSNDEAVEYRQAMEDAADDLLKYLPEQGYDAFTTDVLQEALTLWKAVQAWKRASTVQP